MPKTMSKIAKNAAVTLAAPVFVYVLFFALCAVTGKSGFGVGSDFRVILQNMVYSGFIALAMSYNLTSGRFDFSVGSVLILSVILGCTWARNLSLGPVGMLLLVIAVGLVCGLISGLIYITLRLPPMVTSLGVAMVFEAIAFKFNDSSGVRLMGNFDMLIWAQTPYNLILMGAVLVLLIYLLKFTRFGYNCRSLQSGQKNAVEIGINEKSNAVACYVIAGGLMACAGVIYISQYGYLAPQTGLASSSFLMGAFLPMFIGNALAKYSDRNIGVIVGAFVQACISSGLVRLGVSSSVKAVIDGVIVLLFLVYISNSYKIGLHQLHKEKKELALRSAAAKA